MAHAAVYPSSTSVSGTVAAINPKGVKLDPQQEWFNYSKFAEDIAPPERGASVTLTLDKSGFVRAVQLADGGALSSAAPSAPGATSSQKDRTITRLAVLKAAAEFAASKAESTSTDVLKIAASWERWVLRSDEGAAPQLSTSSTSTEDNVDAF